MGFLHVCSTPECFSGNVYFTIKIFSIFPAHLTAFFFAISLCFLESITNSTMQPSFNEWKYKGGT